MKDKLIITLLIIIIILSSVNLFITLNKRDLAKYCDNRIEEARYQCLLELAHVTLDENICYEIPDIENYLYRSTCLADLAYYKKNVDLCYKINIEDPTRDYCFLNLAGILKDASLCENIISIGILKEKCIEKALN